MTSNAYSAQGTRFLMTTGLATGSAETITAITKAAQAVCTSTGHTLSLGDVVTIAGVAGMTELNGKGYPVVAVGTGVFTLGVNSTNFTTYTSGGTATPRTWVETREHKTYSINPAGRTELDKTTLVSDAKERNYGLKDFGTFNLGINKVESEPAQQKFLAAQDEDAHFFKLIKPNSYHTVFEGNVLSFGESGGVDAIADSQMDIGISGNVFEIATS